MTDPCVQFTLHNLVWNNNVTQLTQEVKLVAKADKSAAGAGPGQVDLEARDPHGRTALMLAVALGRVDCARVLIDAGANVNTECDGWTVVQAKQSTEFFRMERVDF